MALNLIKATIRRQIVKAFNDESEGETPVMRSTNALFCPGSVVWRVHGDVGTMMVGGIAGLFLQMLHPSVLDGVWDHSDFRSDMHGRLRRTARFIATTTYADRKDAHNLIKRIRAMHDGVTGTLPDGTPYKANDPQLLAWVHLTETSSFLRSWVRYGEPLMSQREQDRYFEDMATVGAALGADPVPTSKREAERLMITMQDQLRVDARTREVAHLILQSPKRNGIQAQVPARMAMQAAIDLLPPWARAMHGLSYPALSLPILRSATFALSETIRWAFR